MFIMCAQHKSINNVQRAFCVLALHQICLSPVKLATGKTSLPAYTDPQQSVNMLCTA